ncbi:MAG: aminotransferase class IV [Flavobacteriaceae bacterium]|nr:aminotransferase class IV [Candidatus Onthonaster equi]
MKLNAGGLIVHQENYSISGANRAFSHGDSIKEVLRLVNGEIHDWEDHYFNLMASMRIFRMNIPLSFTPEFFQEEIIKVANANNIKNGKVEFFTFRLNNQNLLESEIDFVISIQDSEKSWEFFDNSAEIEVFKDFQINTSFYALVNAPHPEEYIAEIYALENEYNDLVLLNADKRMARTLKGNIFVVKDNVIKTPKQEEGVIKSVLRNNFIASIKNNSEYEVQEVEIFPFEIQKADEVFILIDGIGIQSVSQNRKKAYPSHLTKSIFNTYFKN